jgi:RNA polymerase sigma-70 factor (ECF subfamily)
MEHRAPGEDETPPGLDALVRERRQLTNLAYRLLGSLADAEDVVQETYARWYAMSPEEQAAIESPGAWLTRVASRICLDLLGSARKRRETYVGEWIPEPLPGHAVASAAQERTDLNDPASRVTLDESISMAFLVLLEAMTPAQRVAFILHDVFRYPFDEVAHIVGRTPAACRQLASAARSQLKTSGALAVPVGGHARLIRDFKRAWEAGDIATLVGLLDPAVASAADGGGVASVAYERLVGAEAVAEAMVHVLEGTDDLVVTERVVNGQPGLVVERDGVVVTVLSFDVVGDRITSIWVVRNPAKLRAWTR